MKTVKVDEYLKTEQRDDETMGGASVSVAHQGWTRIWLRESSAREMSVRPLPTIRRSGYKGRAR
jgi:hypothetical protein